MAFTVEKEAEEFLYIRMYFKKLPEETMAQPAKSLPIWSS
jgi:hypothetical protein